MDEIDILKLMDLGEVPREALIKEIEAANRARLEQAEMAALRANVIHIRVEEFKTRLLKQAGLTEGAFGFMKTEDEDDD